MLIKPLSGYTERVQHRLDRAGALRRRWSPSLRKPPLWSPVSNPARSTRLVNTLEFFVHHEDVRRAQPGWQPRARSTRGTGDALSPAACAVGAPACATVPGRASDRRAPDHGEVTAGNGGPAVTVARATRAS